MTDGDAEPNELVRTRDFEVSGPIELDLSNSVGPVEIELTDDDSARVEVRHDPASGQPDWRSGLAGLLSWVNEQLSESGIRPGNGRDTGSTGGRDPHRSLTEAGAEAVRQTRVDMTGNRLAVHPPKAVPLRNVPLSLKVRAPAESQIGVKTGSGPVTITGSAGKLDVQTGSAPVTGERVTGSATVRTGSGQLRLGEVLATAHARSGSGSIEIASVQSPSSVVTGSGDVWLGELHSDVLVRSGSGSVTVSEAVSGRLELITGSGELRIAVRKGVNAEVDLTSSTGEADSEVSVSEQPPHQEPQLRVLGRTGSGNVFVTSAL